MKGDLNWGFILIYFQWQIKNQYIVHKAPNDRVSTIVVPWDPY